jgi:hypothetical protein
MTRFELLQLLVGQARTNGFDFRNWHTRRSTRSNAWRTPAPPPHR